MKLTITFDIDGKHKQTSEIRFSDWDLWNPLAELEWQVLHFFYEFIKETQKFLDRERESST